jgi:hypothetical protein
VLLEIVYIGGRRRVCQRRRTYRQPRDHHPSEIRLPYPQTLRQISRIIGHAVLCRFHLSGNATCQDLVTWSSDKFRVADHTGVPRGNANRKAEYSQFYDLPVNTLR